MTRLALLFDLDGTLLESDALHHAAFASLLAERGRDLGMDEYKAHIMGQPNSAIMSRFFPGEDADHPAIADRKEAMFRERLGVSAEPVAGIAALLDWAEDAGAGIAVVTNAPRANARAMLDAAGLGTRFATIIIGEECARPKPDPLPYVTAMRALGVTPSNATAFEDSRSGLRAARASGAHVFGLTTGLDAPTLRQAGAHQTLTDFTDPALWAYLQTLKARVA